MTDTSREAVGRVVAWCASEATRLVGLMKCGDDTHPHMPRFSIPARETDTDLGLGNAARLLSALLERAEAAERGLEMAKVILGELHIDLDAAERERDALRARLTAQIVGAYKRPTEKGATG